MDNLIKLIIIFFSSIGFSLIFNVKKKHIPFIALSGVFTQSSFIAAGIFTDNLYICSLIPAVFATLFAEALARILKAPTIIFLLPSIISLVPGGNLYYTMSNLITNNNEQFKIYIFKTIQISLGIVSGIIIVSVAVHHIYEIIKAISHNSTK